MKFKRERMCAQPQRGGNKEGMRVGMWVGGIALSSFLSQKQ